ncbi:hypothetical protein HanIR_Chr11g0548531 [Helianthus annuus]|nr:hypothetical protein HanIR_Chr11g0548531 [Helianthus annuus]
MNTKIDLSEVLVEPGTALTLKVVTPTLDGIETIAAETKTTPADASDQSKTLLVMRYILVVVHFFERAFGKDFLVTVLTDGILTLVNEIKLFGFLERVAPVMVADPRFVKWVTHTIPIFDLATRVSLLGYKACLTRWQL